MSSLLTNPRIAAEFLVWFIGLGLQVAILFRGVAAGLWRHYGFFYAQIAFSFASSAPALWVYLVHRAAFSAYYWETEFLTAFAACGILLDILRHAFALTAATRIFASAARYTVYAAVGLFLVLYIVGHGGYAPLSHLIVLERDFRFVQTALLLGVTAAVFYFGAPLGRNLRGMLVGYGLYIASNLVTLSLESRFPASFDKVWNFLQPAIYCASTVMYLVYLWSYYPPPKLEGAAEITKQADELLHSAPERLRLLE